MFVPAAVDGGDVMDCVLPRRQSDRVNLEVSEFAANLSSIHDGPASAVFLGRFGDKAVAGEEAEAPDQGASVSCVRLRRAPKSPRRTRTRLDIHRSSERRSDLHPSRPSPRRTQAEIDRYYVEPG